MADLDDHLERLQRLVDFFEAHDDEPVRDRVFDLLQQVDHVHRSGIWRLFELMTELGGKGLVDRVTLDPSVKLLFMLYDLIPVDPLQPLEATVQPSAPGIAAGAFIPIDRIGNRKPVWRMALSREDLPPGSMRSVQIGGTPVLICAVDGEIAAFRNGCGRGVLPLHLGVLSDGEIQCPWHGCRFDGRTGRRLDRDGPSLESFSVSMRDGVVYVATNVAEPPTG